MGYLSPTCTVSYIFQGHPEVGGATGKACPLRQQALSVGMKSNGALGKREISGSVFQPHGLFYGLSCPYA